MNKAITSKRSAGRNGKVDPEGARNILKKAFALKRRRRSPLDSLTDDEIIARIKRTREELVKKQFGHLFR